MKRPPFANSYLYHIYNRGVEKRKVFLDDQDYFALSTTFMSLMMKIRLLMLITESSTINLNIWEFNFHILKMRGSY